MDTSEVVAIYGAGLSTALAVSQALRAWMSRTKVSVSVEATYSSRESTYGTPIAVRRGRDVLHESVLITFTIRNLGGNPVQLLGLVIEEIDERAQVLHIQQVGPSGLPVVLEPGTMVEATIQKEHLDAVESCTFLGVVDGTGRRHAVPSSEAEALLQHSWRLPTRLGVYVRRDDPAEQVVAFQAADTAQLTTRPARRRWFGQTPVLAKRPRPVLETLLRDEQPRIKGVTPSSGDVVERP